MQPKIKKAYKQTCKPLIKLVAGAGFERYSTAIKFKGLK
jgi:hypothetical protein